MKVIFLDYDGVVNTPIWNKEGKCGYNFPSDGKVNNYQAIMWLNELCKKTNSKIVISSTWRYCCGDVSYQDCLYNAGLDKKIEIVGCTDWFGNYTRTEEIIVFLILNSYWTFIKLTLVSVHDSCTSLLRKLNRETVTAYCD